MSSHIQQSLRKRASLAFSSLHSRKTVSVLFRVVILLALSSTVFLIKSQTQYQGHATTGVLPFPDTTNNIHVGLSFNYNISDPSTEAGKADYVWGSDYPTQPAGVDNTFYYPFDRDEEQTWAPKVGQSMQTLTWWKTNHPDWIEYQCDKTTVAYEYGDPEVPLDITNPAVLNWMLTTYFIPAMQQGWQGIAFDNVNLDNQVGNSQPGQRCGHYDINGNWVQQFTGGSPDPAYHAAVLNWAQWMNTQLHAINMSITMNFDYELGYSGYEGNTTDANTLIQDMDVFEDEYGFTDAGVGYETDNTWLENIQMAQSAINLGKGYLSTNQEPVSFANLTNDQVQWVLANYLLVKGNHSYVYISGNQEYGSLFIRPEYSAPIGSATNAMYQSQGVWMRDFTNGKTIVNPSSSQSFTVSLPANTYNDLYGNAINSVTLSAHSGIVLLGTAPITPTSTIASPTPTPIFTPTPTPIASDTVPPTVTILTPLSGSTVSRRSTVTLTASASDEVGVTQVSYFINGSLLCTATTAPYTCSWSVPGKPNASYTIKATAYNGAGLTGTDSVIVTAK